MRFIDLLQFAGQALVGHRLRTVLTITGLAVGIAAVVTLTALGEGARRYVTRELTSLGTNLLIVLPGKVETTGAMPYGGVTRDLTLDDVRAIRNRLPLVRRTAPVSMGTEMVRYGGRSRSAAIVGTSADFRRILGLEVGAGRFLAEGDLDQGGSEVVLGSKVAGELFRGESANPLGEAIRIGDWRFSVVGVLAPQGTFLGFDIDDLVIIPVQTNMSMFNRSSLFRIQVEVRSREQIPEVKQQLIDLLAERHREEDVTIISQDAMVASFDGILRALTLALAAIASVSLAVAGVGIMNVMLVSVTERRSEIGLLKALGARSSQILLAFLTEAVLLAILGGLIGLATGWASIMALVQYYPDFPASPPLWAVVAALLLSLVVGVGFGVWPARRATRLDPVSALARR